MAQFKAFEASDDLGLGTISNEVSWKLAVEADLSQLIRSRGIGHHAELFSAKGYKTRKCRLKAILAKLFHQVSVQFQDHPVEDCSFQVFVAYLVGA